MLVSVKFASFRKQKQYTAYDIWSPIGFSGSGIWLILKPGFGISKEKEDETFFRDCNYDRNTGFGDFNRRESGNVALKKPRFEDSRD